MNIIHSNKVILKFEGIWRPNINPTTSDYDDENILIPYPKPYKKEWHQSEFLEKLKNVEKILINKKSVIKYDPDKHIKCLLGKDKSVSTFLFKLNNIFWENSLIHYIEYHQIKPSNEFINTIMTLNVIKNELFYTPATMKVKFGVNYLKLHRNQIAIIDALFHHGSYSKKYLDENQKDVSKKYRYSEHAGLIDFDNEGVTRIVISGNTTRKDVGDEEIYLPENMIEAYNFEYFFHTHPATPKPGGRADIGILYEFPSSGDIFHFIEHYNQGSTQGSMVLAAEGLYIIRKNIIDNRKINLNKYKYMYNDINIILHKAHEKSILKYGSDFTTKYFHTIIAYDQTFINHINDQLHKYDLHIDFVPRVLGSEDNWIIDSFYIPIYVTENDNKIIENKDWANN